MLNKDSSFESLSSERVNRSDSSPVTYMELARWLSEGRGYCHDSYTGKVITHFTFDLVAKDCPFNKK